MIKYLKENKKGISLVEIIVALAIAGIIVAMLGTVISQGTILFNRQNTIVDLANESQLVSGQIEQCLMEATGITIYHDSANGCEYIYTGEIDKVNGGWANATGVERTIIVKDEYLYISNEFVADADMMNEGNMISSYLKSFNIGIAENSTEKITDEANAVVGIKYLNPMVVEVDYLLETDDSRKAANITIKLRNYITQCYEGGKPVSE